MPCRYIRQRGDENFDTRMQGYKYALRVESTSIPCAFSEVKQRMELRHGMRYPEQRSLISALLQLDVYYRSARSTPTLLQYIHTYVDDCRPYARSMTSWREIFRGMRPSVCVNMGAIYVGMRRHNTSTNVREYVRRQERPVTNATKRLSETLWECFYGQTLCQGRKMDMNLLCILGHVSLESTKPMHVMLSGSNGLRIQRL